MALATAELDETRWVAPYACKIVSIGVASGVTTSGSSATKYYHFLPKNKTQTVDLLAAAKTTNGAEITANTLWDVGTLQNDVVAAGDVILLEMGRCNTGGEPTDLTGTAISMHIRWRKVRA